MTKKAKLITIVSAIAAVLVAVAVVLGLYFGGVIGNYVHRTIYDFDGFSDFSAENLKSIEVDFHKEGREINLTVESEQDIAEISAIIESAEYELTYQTSYRYPGFQSYPMTFNFKDGSTAAISASYACVRDRHYDCDKAIELCALINELAKEQGLFDFLYE